MFYTVYKITNKINDKIYIGAHKTSDLDDGYMGSGNIIKKAIKKYGVESFEKEILEVFNSSEDMYEMESKLVTKDFIQADTNYNLKEGGLGGFDHLNNDYEKMVKRNMKAGHLNYSSLVKWRLENPEEYKKNKEAVGSFFTWYNKNVKTNFATFTGKTHSDESKKKMSNAKKGKVSGENNSQFGSMWIHNLQLKVSKKIKKEEFSDWEAKGWLKGRKMKF